MNCRECFTAAAVPNNVGRDCTTTVVNYWRSRQAAVFRLKQTGENIQTFYTFSITSFNRHSLLSVILKNGIHITSFIESIYTQHYILPIAVYNCKCLSSTSTRLNFVFPKQRCNFVAEHVYTLGDFYYTFVRLTVTVSVPRATVSGSYVL